MRLGKIVLSVRFFGCLPFIFIGAFTERIHFYSSMLVGGAWDGAES